MATIIVETGAGLTNSNSYVSESDLATYASDRGVTITGTAAVLIIQAMDYLESRQFLGTKSDIDQALQWPRFGVEVDAYYVDSDEIPTLLKQAEMEICIAIDGGVDPLANLGRETKREKVGDLEVEYAIGARPDTYLTAAEAKLRKLLVNPYKVYRA
ncbi:MAG: hypothetical protein K8963_05860 [Proteobacteria bacterium]|jgi:hypothetical protein|nr:hypothetical protein [Pseudomonadota bacterium]